MSGGNILYRAIKHLQCQEGTLQPGYVSTEMVDAIKYRKKVKKKQPKNNNTGLIEHISFNYLFKLMCIKTVLALIKEIIRLKQKNSRKLDNSYIGLLRRMPTHDIEMTCSTLN